MANQKIYLGEDLVPINYLGATQATGILPIPTTTTTTTSTTTTTTSTTTTTTTLGYPYGDFLYGGWVFYVDGNDWYIATDTNIGSDFNDVLGIDCGTSNGIGTGPTNTQLLADRGSSVAIAALAANYEGYNDWFIPSYTLLQQMCANKIYIPNFSSGNYRSSTEGISGSRAYYIGGVRLDTCGVVSNTYKRNLISFAGTRLVRKQTV